jgi:predicted GIY-YIG superfamily endonuclease
VLENGAGKYYIGISDDLARRVSEHNSGLSRWTRGKGPWTLVWASDFLSLSDARKLENKLKRQGRGSGFYSTTGLQRPGS